MKLRFIYRSPNGDGGGGNGAADQAALLTKIKENVKQELEARGFQNEENVKAVVNQLLNGLPLEALRAYDAEKLQTTITGIAAELEKIKNNRSGDAGAANPIADFFEANQDAITALFQARKGVAEGGVEIKFNIRAAAVMTTGNTIDETTHAVPVELIESMSTAAFVAKRRGVEFINDIAEVTTVQSLPADRKTWLEEGDEQGAFAIVAEGGLKPLVSQGLVRNFAKSRKIAGKYVITEEFAKFRQDSLNIIRRLINDKILRELRAILVVDLNAQAAGYLGTTLDDTIVVPNDYDVIAAVAAQIESLNFIPDVLILNPQDKWRIRTNKDSDNRYLFPVVTENGTTKIYEFTVITTTYQPAGSLTLGESGLFKVEQEPITVRLGYGITTTSAVVSGTSVITSVVSDFDNNQMRMIVETFFLDYLATPNIGSFVKTTFATVKAALLKP
jgi:hypothetical protein